MVNSHRKLKEFKEHSGLIFQQLRQANYKMPPGYKQWDELSYSIASQVASIGKIYVDFISNYVSHRLALWMIKDAPIYCLNKDLIGALIETTLDNLEKILPDLPVALPTFLLLLPPEALQTPQGDSIEYMVVHVSQKHEPENSQGASPKYPGIEIKNLKHESNLLIDCSAVDSGGFIWLTGVNLETDGSISFEKGDNRGSAPMSQDDLDFTNSLRVLFIQILLLITYVPDLLTDSSEADLPTKGRGFSKPSKGTEPTQRYPRWLGKNHKTAIEVNMPQGGTHKSPETHWRKGHFKKVAIGKNRMDRKVVWIPPVLVNSNS